MAKGASAFCLALGLCALPVFSTDGNARELIVRLKEPQNHRQQAIATFQQLLDGQVTDQVSALDIVNEEEGLVKLSFDSDQAYQNAKAQLDRQEAVESVTENRLIYRPMVRYSLREVEGDIEGGNGESKLGSEFFPAMVPQALSRMAGLPDVKMPPAFVAGADPISRRDWVFAKISQPALGTPLVHPSIVTAVIDTGIDYNHEDLSGGLWRRSGKPREIGFDFAHNTDRPYDMVHFDLQGCLDDSMCSSGYQQERFLVNPGHGTHCAGHIAAVAGNSAGIQGTGAGTPLIGIKVFFDKGEKGAGSASDAAIIRGIDYAIKNGAKIISASWGGPSSRADAERSELKKAMVRAQKAGVLVVIAAGNSTLDQDNVAEPDYPAAFNLDNLIVVAATDQQDRLADFSNFGKKSVHLAAPGVKILSTTVGNNYSDVVAKAKTKNGKDIIVDWDGTSMATPIVAGAVAAVWSKYPTLKYKQIRDRIFRSVRRVSGLAGKVSTGGVLNVEAALR